MNRVNKFTDINEVQFFLNGGIIGTNVARGIDGLVGRQIQFTSPAFTVTFVAVSPTPTTRDPYKLLLGDIKAQVEAANASISVQSIGGKIIFIEKLPLNGVAIAAAQAGAALLGFDPVAATVGKLYRPLGISGGPPNYTWAYSINESTHVLFTWE